MQLIGSHSDSGLITIIGGIAMIAVIVTVYYFNNRKKN